MGFGGPTWGGADPTEPLGKPDLFEMYGGVPERIEIEGQVMNSPINVGLLRRFCVVALSEPHESWS
jgi:hypothetical protein